MFTILVLITGNSTIDQKMQDTEWNKGSKSKNSKNIQIIYKEKD